jgi:hypothetical protein
MRTPVAHYLHASLCSLRRRPVLSAMMVYSIGFGAAALVATIAVWRSTSMCPASRRPEHLYVVRIVSGDAARIDPKSESPAS